MPLPVYLFRKKNNRFHFFAGIIEKGLRQTLSRVHCTIIWARIKLPPKYGSKQLLFAPLSNTKIDFIWRFVKMCLSFLFFVRTIFICNHLALNLNKFVKNCCFFLFAEDETTSVKRFNLRNFV